MFIANDARLLVPPGDDHAKEVHSVATTTQLWASSPLVSSDASVLHLPSKLNAKLDYRSATFANIGFQEVLEKPRAPVVTMILKYGRRAVENSAEIFSHLQQQFTWANFQIMQGDKIAQMSLKDQVQAVCYMCTQTAAG